MRRLYSLVWLSGQRPFHQCLDSLFRRRPRVVDVSTKPVSHAGVICNQFGYCRVRNNAGTGLIKHSVGDAQAEDSGEGGAIDTNLGHQVPKRYFAVGRNLVGKVELRDELERDSWLCCDLD